MTGKTANRTANRQDISARLHEAIDGLHKDVTRVEMWATALAALSQPVPDYPPDPRYELGQPVKIGSLPQSDVEKAPGNEDRKPLE